MKTAAVSSASSLASELTANASSSNTGGGDGEQSQTTKTSARMSSSAADDSCAINELLEGRMDLSVGLPDSDSVVVVNVERRTPMLDLLVGIATQYRFNAANYMISAADRRYNASTPIGSLDVGQISIVRKPAKVVSPKSGPPAVPFQATFRLQINLPRNQLMVLRVTPNASLAAIKQAVCSEKCLEPAGYQLVKFVGHSEAPKLLDPNLTIGYYSLNEVTLVSTKTLSRLLVQCGPTAGQTGLDLPDFSGKKGVRRTSSVISLKKRPAPPPPTTPTTPTVPVIVEQQNNNTNNNHNSQPSPTLTKCVPNKSDKQNGAERLRQNSGSDSSGYHESVLSSDSPESSSPNATLPKCGPTEANGKLAAPKTGVTPLKKRRAPPPPKAPPNSRQTSTAVVDNDGEIILDKLNVTLECVSDASLSLSSSPSPSSSTSSSLSSCSPSSINNKSLSPIIITQTNGWPTTRHSSSASKNSPFETLAKQSVETEGHASQTAILSANRQLPESVITAVEPTADESVSQTSADRDGQPLTGAAMEALECESNATELESAANESIADNAVLTRIANTDNVEKLGEQTNGANNSRIGDGVAVTALAPAVERSHASDASGRESVDQMAANNNVIDADHQDSVQECISVTPVYSSDCKIDPMLDLNGSELSATTSSPLPSPTSADPTSNYGDSNCTVSETADSTAEGVHEWQSASKLEESFGENGDTQPEAVERVEAFDTNAMRAATRLIVADEDTLSREIEATLQTLNDELDRFDARDADGVQASPADTSFGTANHPINNNDNAEDRGKQNTIIADNQNNGSICSAPNVIEINGKSQAVIIKHESRESAEKVLLLADRNDAPETRIRPNRLEITRSLNEDNSDKDSAHISHRHLLKPRVKLANFSIGSYKKEVDIFHDPQEETVKKLSPVTAVSAPVIVSNNRMTFADIKPFLTAKSVSVSENKVTVNGSVDSVKSEVDQNKPKVNIATKPAFLVSPSKPESAPVIQKLVTTAPKVKRFNSFNGVKSCAETSKSDTPYASGPHVSQISIINGSAIDISTKKYATADRSKSSPNQLVRSLIAKTEFEIQNRSPSPSDTPQVKTDRERTTILIGPSKQSIKVLPSPVVLNAAHRNQSKAIPSPPVPPPQPVPIATSTPKIQINFTKSRPQMSASLFHPKGWTGGQADRNGGSSPPMNGKGVDDPAAVRDSLLNDIKNFGGKDSLKKVAKNTSWRLEIYGDQLTT